MVQELLSRVFKGARHIAFFLFFLFSATDAISQSVLLPGDVVVVTVNSADDSFDLIPLVNIEPGTSLYFTTGKWDSSTKSISDGLNAQIIFNEPVAPGTNIHINSGTDDRFSLNGNLDFTGEGDQILAYQSDQNLYRFIFGVSWGGSITSDNTIPYDIPEILTQSVNNFLELGSYKNYQYYLKNGASGTVHMLQDMVDDSSNWRGRNESAFIPFETAFRLLNPPVIVFDDNVSSKVEGDTMLLNVAIYGHDGSRLTVDAVFNEFASTADTNDIGKFKRRSFNFTGLIGDAEYGFPVPVSTDNQYEGSETAFFELMNLSKGNFGDFVSHVLFIGDSDIPAIEILEITYTGNSAYDYIEIQNNEQVSVDIGGWSVSSRGEIYRFDNNTFIDPLSSVKLLHPDERLNNDKQTKWLQRNNGEVSLLNPQGNVISKLNYSIQNSSGIIAVNKPETAESITVSSISSVETADSESSVKSKSEQKKKIEGWYPVTKKQIAENPKLSSGLYYWNEVTANFEEYKVSESNSAYSYIRYFDEESLLATQYNTDNIDSGLVQQNQKITIKLSSTDINKNEVIDGSEGFNLLLNNTSSSLTVSDFIAQVESNYSEGVIYPYIYLWPDNGHIWDETKVLSGNDEIPIGGLFWVRADSLFETLEIEIESEMSGSQLVNPEIMNEETYSPTSIQILLSGVDNADSATINIYSSDQTPPRDLISPEMEPSLRINTADYTHLGAGSGLNWNSILNFRMMEDQKVIIPLAFITSKEGELKLSVSDWKSVPANWKVQIEDLYKEEIFELDPSWTYDFEYLPQTPDTDSEMKSSIYANQENEERFRLVIIPPGFNEQQSEKPEEVTLNQNFPNPFNPVTVISFNLPQSERVKLSVFNVVGQPVAVLTDGIMAGGDHEFEWDASGLPSGMYIYQLEVGNRVMTRKMTLVK